MKLLKQIYKKYTNLIWNVGFLENQNLNDLVNGKKLNISWVKHNFSERWFADPFILDYDENLIRLLVEEFYPPIKRGRISRIVIRRSDMSLQNVDPVLTADTHLSFPAILRVDGRIYIYPENGASGKLILYEYNITDNTVKEVSILSNERLADAVIAKVHDLNCMFCTVYPDYNNDVLDIYKENGGRYSPWMRYSFNGDKIARMAGDLFEVNGKLYRPAQDCNFGYGSGLVIQEVSFEKGYFSFKNIRRLTSPSKRYNVGFHTLNSYNGIVVVDARGYQYPLIGKLLNTLRNILK